MSTPTDIDTGGPAFASATCGEWQDGMTLRDWFAGQTLAGWCAASTSISGKPLNMTEDHAKQIAEGCYRYADAMIEARKQKGIAA